MKRKILTAVVFGFIISLLIIASTYINNYFFKDEAYYLLYNDKITSITSVVGKRKLKQKKVSTIFNKKDIKKIYFYSDLKDTPSDLSKYISYLRENENFLVTKSFDLNNDNGEIELSKYSKENNYIILINVKYDKNSYKISITRGKGTIKNY